MRVIPSSRPLLSLWKSCVCACIHVCCGTPQSACTSQDTPGSQFTSEAEDQEPPGQNCSDLWVPRGTAAVVSTHARSGHTRYLRSQATSRLPATRMSVQSLEPLAFPGSRLENALRREPAVSSTLRHVLFWYLNAYLNKSKRYRITKNILLVIVSGICCVLGHIFLSKTAFKNPKFSFLLWNLQKINKKQRKSIILLKNVALTKSHLVNSLKSKK